MLQPIDAGRRPILLVEDDDAVRRALHLMLTWRGYRVRAFASAEAARGAGAFGAAAVAVLDHQLPGEDGLALLADARAGGWVGRAVLITGHDAARLVADPRIHAADAVLAKPLREHELIAALAQ